HRGIWRLFFLLFELAPGGIQRVVKPQGTSPRPALASGFTMKDRPPRQHRQALRFNSLPPLRVARQQPPVLPGYDLSSEMGPESSKEES
ncbi:hypothetical protein AVEN_150057-1, partial [Araneus ventricosus]